MKTRFFFLVAVAAVTCSAQATLTLNGLAASTAYPSAPPSARLGLIIVGSGTNGDIFLDSLTSGAGGVTGNGLNGAKLGTGGIADLVDFPSSAAGLSVGSTFGGNTVIGQISSQGTFVNGANNSIADANATKKFAIVWTSLANLGASNPSAAPGGTLFGIARSDSWTLGAIGTTLGFNTALTASNPYSRILVNQAGASTASFGQVEIASQGLAFSVIPEPSAALLGALGALGLLRRRRN